MRLPRNLAVLAVAVAMAVASCSSSEPEVEFGEGELPAAVPDDFPIPPGSSIGATLVDRVNTQTEVNLTVPNAMSDLARYFSVSLVSAGYVVDASSGDALGWTIDFRRGDLRGSIEMRTRGEDAASAVVTLNDI